MKTILNRSVRIARIPFAALLVVAVAAFAAAEKDDDRWSRRGDRGDLVWWPALEIAGDAGRGHGLFLDLCAGCHRSGDSGGGPGPDLSRVGNWKAEKVLHDIVDPNAEVDDEYVSYIVETTDGEVYTGLLVESTGGGVVLRVAGDLIEVPAERVRDVRSDGLSTMPEGLTAGLEHADMADLLAFLNR
ncbi:MAG: c-type cytochrome [Acidobacteria bacterium]|nr:c-type cytochrome [Acidobacteriota bacterium]